MATQSTNQYHQFITGSALSGTSLGSVDLYTVLSAVQTPQGAKTANLYYGTKDGASFVGTALSVSVADAGDGTVIAKGTHTNPSGVNTPALATWQMKNGNISLHIIAAVGLSVLEEVPASGIVWGSLAFYV